MAKTGAPVPSPPKTPLPSSGIIKSNQKGTNYVSKYNLLAYAPTNHERAHRAALAYLADRWTTLSAGDQNTWAALVPATYQSNYHAFMGDNLSEWQLGNQTRLRYDADPGVPAPKDLSGYDSYARGLVLKLKIWGTSSSATQSVILAVAASAPSIVDHNTLTFMVPWSFAVASKILSFRVAEHGTYHWRFRTVNTQGLKLGTVETESQATE